MMSDPEIGNADVMDFRDLRTFVTVARAGSFTVAARELGYTQSAVSQQVASLESSVGRALLLRRPVRLTPAGERLAEHAAHILLRLDVAHSELARTEGEPQQLRISMTPLATADRVARALRLVRASTPGVVITVATTDATAAAASVAEGRADLAIVDGVVAPGNPLAVSDAGLLASFAVLEQAVAIVVPTDHPIRRAAIGLDALLDAQWIDAPLLTTGATGIPGWSGSTGAASLSFHGSDIVTLLELVAGGHGLTMLPRRVCEAIDGVRPIEIARPSLVHRTEVLLLRNNVDRYRSIIDSLRS